MKLSIIIPAYNEAQFIDELIRRIRYVKLYNDIIKEIIIIDDGSTDETTEILQKYIANSDIRILRQERNMGKTSAVMLEIENSTGDIILIQDADLEYNPDDYPRLTEPIIKGKTSVVYGSRFKGKIERMSVINRIANILTNLTVDLLFHTRIGDVNTCYKVFRIEVLKDIKLTSENFGFETEITAKLLNKGYKIYEVPIKYIARSKKEGKKMTWLKALELYWGIIKYRFKKDV